MNRMNAPQTFREIPFDHTVKFKLTGNAGTRLQQVINISSEGPFIATHMSFGVVMRDYQNVKDGSIILNSPDPRRVELEEIKLLTEAAEHFLFFYTLVDSGTGRELQNDKLFQIATIGKGDGERPYRAFSQPMMFIPRSTVRVEIEEIIGSNLYKEAELWFVLQGYKILA